MGGALLLSINANAGATPLAATTVAPKPATNVTTNETLSPYIYGGLTKSDEVGGQVGFGVRFSNNFNLGVEANINNKFDDIKSDRFLGVVGYSFKNSTNLTPYISAKAGVARLSHQFNSQNFQATNFTYGVGAGVDFEVTKSVSIGMEYNYFNQGKIKGTIGATSQTFADFAKKIGVYDQDISSDAETTAKLVMNHALTEQNKYYSDSSFNQNDRGQFQTIGGHYVDFQQSKALTPDRSDAVIDVLVAGYLASVLSLSSSSADYYSHWSEYADIEKGVTTLKNLLESGDTYTPSASFSKESKVHAISLNVKYVF